MVAKEKVASDFLIPAIALCALLVTLAANWFAYWLIYRRKRALLGPNADTLIKLIEDVKCKKREAIDRDEVIFEDVDGWLHRSNNLVHEYDSKFNKLRPSRSGATTNENYRRIDNSSHSITIGPVDDVGPSGRVDAVPDESSRLISDRVEQVGELSTLWGSFSNYCCFYCNAIEQVVILDFRLNEAITTGRKFERVSRHRAQPPTAPMRIVTVDNFKMTSSVKTALGEVMAALKEDGNSNGRYVGVHGVPGVGKTTVVKKAAAKAMEEKLFDRVVFSTVSASVDLEKIQKEAAECLGISLSSEYREKWASVIQDKIMREKKVLIILDDVWEELDLISVGIPSRNDLEKCGSKVVFTTRKMHVCSVMKCQTIGLEIWSNEESREFLKKTAGTNFEVSRGFEDIANDVADECEGLPLALNILTKALGDKPMEEWKRALSRLKNSESPHPDYGNKVFSSIKLSYDYLKLDAKMCFLLCCLFPEDHNIGKEELARYAFGLGLFPNVSSLDKVRGETGTQAEVLKDCGLLLPVDHDLNRERVKMHDVIRDVAIQIASFKEGEKEEETKERKKQVFIVQPRNQESQEWPLRESYKIYTAISVISNRICELPGSPECPNLETLLLQDNNLTKISIDFFKQMNALRVLNLSRIQTNLLPPSTKSLKELRTLHLDGCKLTDVSVLGDLQMLAVLSLRESSIEEVPESMGNLGKLRMLDLTLSRNIKRIPPNVLSRMRSLEELYLKGSFSQWHDKTDQETINNVSFSELINLHRLTILEVDIANSKSLLNLDVKEAPKWSKFDICICGQEYTRSFNMQPSSIRDNVYKKNLLLDTSIKDFPDWFIEAVSKKTEKVMYADTKKVNMFEEQAKGRLARLKSLMLDKYNGVSYLTWGISDSNPVFESLEELQIYDSSIQEICDGDLPMGSFKNLESLTVNNCHVMKATVLSLNFIKRVNCLGTLHVNRADAKEVFALPDDPSLEQRYLGKLREMRLEDLYKLETVWKGQAQFADLGNLKLVSVIKCVKLRNIFSVNILSGLSKLEDLWVENCDEMEAIVGEGEISPETVTIRLPNLKTLCLSNLPRLTKFCSQNLNLVCPVLEYVHIHECSQFRTTYFNSSKEVHRNNDQHMKSLKKRMAQGYF